METIIGDYIGTTIGIHSPHSRLRAREIIYVPGNTASPSMREGLLTTYEGHMF